MAVIGRANVEKELASLERRFAQHARTLARTTGMGSVSGGGARGGGAASAAQASADRAAQKAIRDQQRAIDQRLRSQAALHRQRTREESQFATAQARTNAAQQRAIDRQVRSQVALSRQRAREERSVARERDRSVSARADFVRSTVGGGARRVIGGLTSVGAAGASMLGLGGTALAASAVTSAVGLDERTRRLSILGRKPGEKGIDPESLRKQFVQTGLASGFSAESVAGGVEAFTAKTGDMGTALKNQRVFATVAQGAGAQVEEVFSAAADLSTKLNVSSVEEMSQAFAILSQQGKKGSFELKAMAAEFPEILAGAASAGVKGVSGVRDVGAIMQIARQASGSDSEATTAVQTFFRQLSHEAKDLASGKALGGKKVSVFEGNDARNPMRNFADIAKDVLIQSEGDLTKFQKVFDIRGTKAGAPLLNAFRDARATELTRQKNAGEKVDNRKAVAAGADAVSALFSSFRDVDANFATVQQDAADAMKSTAVQLTNLSTQFKEVIGSQLLPELNKLIPVLTQMIPHFAKLVSGIVNVVNYLMENPFKGVGIALAIAIGAEVAKARIGAILATALTTMLAANAAAGGGLAGARAAGATLLPTVGAASTNKLAAAGTGLAIGAAVAGSIYAGGVAKFEAGEDNMASGGQALNFVRNAGVENIEQVRAAISEQKKRLAATQKTDLLDDTLDFFGASNKKVEAKTQESFLQEMQKQLASLEMKQAAEATKAAADSLKAAADAQNAAAGNKPNTSDKPTGVK